MASQRTDPSALLSFPRQGVGHGSASTGAHQSPPSATPQAANLDATSGTHAEYLGVFATNPNGALRHRGISPQKHPQRRDVCRGDQFGENAVIEMALPGPAQDARMDDGDVDSAGTRVFIC